MAITALVAGPNVNTGVWVEAYILRRFVDMLKGELVFAARAQPATIPKSAGAYVARWNIPAADRGDTTARVDAAAGTTGELANTTITSVEQTVQIYGEFMKIGKLANDSDIPGTLDVYTEQFMYRGASAIEDLLYTEAKTSTNFLHSGDVTTAGVTLATGDVCTAQDFPAIAGFFHSKNAKGFSDLMGDFVWLMNPAQETHLTTEFTTTKLSWANVNKNVPAGFDQLIKVHRFVGRYGGVTAIRTTTIVTITEDVTAFHSIALAKWGLGTAGLGRTGPSKPTIKYKQPGPGDTSQPLDLYDTLAWKVLLAERMLDSNRVLVVYSAQDAA